MSLRLVRKLYVAGDLTDADAPPTLSDPTSSFGVKRLDAGAVLATAGTLMTRDSLGVYSYTIDDPVVGTTYRWWPRVTVNGDVYTNEKNTTYVASGVDPVESLLSTKDVRDAVDLKDANRENELIGLSVSVSELWEKATNRLWMARTGYVEDFVSSIKSGTSLYPRLLPIVGPLSVSQWSNRDGESLAEDVEAARYRVDYPRAIVSLVAAGSSNQSPDFLFWKDNIRLEYDGGLEPTNVPMLVKRALKMQLAYEFTRWEPANLAVKQRTARGGGTYFHDSDLHPLFARAAESYTRHV